MKIAIAGSSGFIGAHLVSFFKARGDTLVLLTRKERSYAHFWSPEERQIDPSILEGCDGVINLCGESIIGRWTQAKMDRIRESRFQATDFLVETLAKLTQPPKVYVGASAVGYYGERGNESVIEESPSGHGYLAEVCRGWEERHRKVEQLNVRVVIPRFGLVLGPGGGALQKMLPPFRMGAGGRLGAGNQWMSWIAVDDCVEAIAHLIEQQTGSGPFNFVAPEPVTNKEFTKILGEVLKKPTPFPLPKWVLGFLFGSGAEIFLASLKVEPRNLLKSGYAFRFPQLEVALRNYLQINKQPVNPKI